MRFYNDSIIEGGDGSQTLTSSLVDTSCMVCASLAVITTGTTAGTMKLQASNDTGTPTNFVDIPSATVAVAGPGVVMIPKLDVSYQYMRAIYTFTSGTGTVTAKFKAIGF